MSEYKDYGYVDDSFSCAHSFLLNTIEKLLNSGEHRSILDIGCGNGAVANFLISKGFDVYGTDASSSGIQIANKKNPGRFFIQDLSIDEMPSEIKNKQFDTVISTEVVEHLYDPRKYISICKSILRCGGTVIISTPYHGYLKNLALSIFNHWDKHHTPLWDGGHIKFWSKRTLTVLLEEQGFKVEKIIGIGRMPYLWKSMVLIATLK
ncbi:MAG: class I SAM-dependent methyltransferase [Bacteroidales bacterium]|jgi:2-polyprenyl-3-methyl-5-hydroxy-6-metoxy-1,4-benzoquinol methylase|nr:class I SAM-dependent methyltransferase [Bacteroidales bacterium]